MQIILVDTNIIRLNNNAALLKQSVPDMSVFATSDPLMAAQYGRLNPVDILIALLNMQRMDGFQLSSFMHSANPRIKAWIMAKPQEFDDCIENCEGFRHKLLLPVSADTLIRITRDSIL